MKNNSKTIFCDIDGVLLYHHGDLSRQIICNPIILPETLRVLNDWERKGYRIILVTGRKECLRKITEKQLLDCGVFYDQLIMSVGNGIRVIINDDKPDGTPTCQAFCPKRNSGISGLDI